MARGAKSGIIYKNGKRIYGPDEAERDAVYTLGKRAGAGGQDRSDAAYENIRRWAGVKQGRGTRSLNKRVSKRDPEYQPLHDQSTNS